MKHRGARMEYADERMRDLAEQFYDYLSECDFIRMPEVYRAIVERPARRFYVSDKRATVVVSSLLRGECPQHFRPLKLEMFREIMRRVLLLMEKHPKWSVGRCCAEVVEQPAPKFYLTAGSAKVMICRYKKERYEERKKKLQHLFY